MNNIVTDYYPDFRCKMGNCRHSCCQNWPVSVSVSQYNKLLGVRCSHELRTKIKSSLVLNENQSFDEYAELRRDQNNICMLRNEKGLCLLQLELGEEMLPDVCRCYPRSIRHYGKERHECALSASCEAVVEHLISRKKPLSLISAPLKIDSSLGFENPFASDKADKLRDNCFNIMRDTDKTIRERFISLLEHIQRNDFISSSDKEQLSKRLETEKAIPDDNDLKKALSLMVEISNVSKGFSFASSAARNLLGKQDFANAYRSAAENFDNTYPNWQMIFTNLLLNYMFYEQFPSWNLQFVSAVGNLKILLVVYSLLRVVLVCSIAENPSQENLVDVTSAFFRFFNHSDVDSLAKRKELFY